MSAARTEAMALIRRAIEIEAVGGGLVRVSVTEISKRCKCPTSSVGRWVCAMREVFEAEHGEAIRASLKG